MNPALEKFLPILQKSLLMFLSEEDRTAVLGQGQVVKVDRGQRLPRLDKPQELLIILSGEVSIRMLHGPEVGRMGAGRSLELRALIFHEQKWLYDWFAEETCEILYLPWTAFEPALAKNERNFQYLGRISQSIAIQRLKRDLVGLGVSRATIIEIISSLHFETADNLFSDWNRRAFCTIYHGEIRTILEFGQQPVTLGVIQAGDSGLLDLSRGSFSFETSDDLRAWVIFENEWKKFAGLAEFERFLSAFGGSGATATSVDAPGQPRVLSPANSKGGRRARSPSAATSSLAQVGVGVRLRRWFLHQWYRRRVFSCKNEIHSGISVMVTIGRLHGLRFGPEALSFRSGGLFCGQSLDGLEIAAKSHGFNVHSHPVQSFFGGQVSGPVVVECVSGLRLILSKVKEHYLVAEPVTGRLHWLTADALRSAMIPDRVVQLEVTERIESLGDPPIPYLQLFGVLFANPRLILFFVMAGIIGYVTDLSVPVLNQYLFDVVVGQGVSEPFLPVIGLIFLLTVASNRIGIFRQRLSVDLGSAMTLRLKSLYQNKILRMSPGDVQALGPSSGLTRSLDLDEVGGFFVDGVLNSVMSIVLMGGAFSVLWLYHPGVAVLAVLFTPVEILAVRLLQSRVEGYRLEAHLLRAEENRMMVEHFAGSESLRSLKAQLTSWWRWQSNSNQGRGNIKRSAIVQGAFELLTFMFGELVKIVCFVSAIGFYLRGEMTLGQVLGTTMLVGKVSAPIRGMVAAYFRFFSVRPLLLKLSEVIDAPVEQRKMTGSRSDLALMGDVEFRNVDFSYQSSHRGRVLRGLNFSIEAGQKIAIVGRSGAGKTSLAMLINGLRAPVKGEVRIDDRSARELGPWVLRDQVALVEQEGSLFAGPILDNIAQGDSAPDVERAQWAARMAEIEEEILARPGGFSSPLLQGGVGLSEGQKQRLLIARAIYRNPSILVLDEATCHLDPISEERVMERIMSEFKRKTVILCTQRVHLAQRADRVLFIENGKLREEGTHQELIQKRDKYYRFFIAHLSLG